jgi:cytoskeleton protein RodZ
LTDESTPAGGGRPAPADPSAHGSTIGAALAAARATRGMSVEDVAAATRIRATLVRGIEDDDFSHCGGMVYARGHIKSIAQVVGADPGALVAWFDRQYGDPAPKVTSSPLPAFSPPREVRGPRARWASVAVAVLAVAVVFLGVSWVIGRGQNGDKAQAGPVTTPPATTSSSSSPPPVTSSSKPAPPVKPRPAGVQLKVTANDGDSWLSVTNSHGSEIYQGILASGQVKQFSDGHSLKIKFGNSRVVTLNLNGQDVGAPQCDKQVCSVEYLPPHATEG